jgi:hypothetical protein
VYLATSKVAGIPRRVCGADVFTLLGNLFKQTPADVPPELLAYSPPIVGATYAISLYSLAAAGVRLCGRAVGVHADGCGVDFAADLADNVSVSQAGYDKFVEMLTATAAEIEQAGVTLEPYEVDAEWSPSLRDSFDAAQTVQSAPTSLRFADAGISDIFFACGWDVDYSWLQVQFAENAACSTAAAVV